MLGAHSDSLSFLSKWLFNMVSEQSRSNDLQIQAPHTLKAEEVSDNTAAPLLVSTSTSLASSSVLISISMPLPSYLLNSRPWIFHHGVLSSTRCFLVMTWPDGLCWWLCAMPFEDRCEGWTDGLTKSCLHLLGSTGSVVAACYHCISLRIGHASYSIRKNISWSRLANFMQIDLVQEWWILRSGSPSLAVARNQTCGRILATDKGYLWWVSHHWCTIFGGRYHYSCSQWPGPWV